MARFSDDHCYPRAALRNYTIRSLREKDQAKKKESIENAKALDPWPLQMLLFSYRDVDFYHRDLLLFEEGAWLNDTAIHFCFQTLVSDKRVKLVDPAVVSFLRLQVEEEQEFAELRAGLELHRYDWLFLPINDNTNFHGGCSHWSLLACHLVTGTTVSMDSNSQYNFHAASSLLGKLGRLIGKLCGSLLTAKCPQQSNGDDCGVFVVIFAESLLSFIESNPSTPVNEDWIAQASEHLTSHFTCTLPAQTRKRFKSQALELARQRGSL